MDKPQRVQLKRTKGWRMPPNTVKVDRTTSFGNPYQGGKDGDGNPKYLVDLFREYLDRPEQAHLVQRVRNDLKGRNLACWCAPDKPCHADVLLQVANAPEAEV